jgi:alpha-methylacyl-CoA racemase
MVAQNEWVDRRGENIIDGGAHFYGVYETADGKFVSVGAIEPQFYRLLLDTLGLAEDQDFIAQLDKQQWPQLRERLDAVFRAKTRDEWCRLMEHTDICFAPVLSMSEAPGHPQAVARGSFATIDGVAQPAPAPRYSHTPLDAPRAPRPVTLEELGITMETIA